MISRIKKNLFEKAGFTLIELLLVVAILAVILSTVMPNFAALGGTQASMAARDAIQLVKYARNMAILNQIPVDVQFGSDGTLRVAPQQTQSASIVATAAADLQEQPTKIDLKPAQKRELVTGSVEEIAVSRTYRGVAYSFVEYTDGYDDTKENQIKTGRGFVSLADNTESENENGVEPKKSNAQTFTLTVRSNGTCRPFRIRIHDAEVENGGCFVKFDMLGTGEVEEL